MKKPGPNSRKTSQQDTGDEALVWKFVAEGVEPLKRRKGRVHTAADFDTSVEGPKRQTEPDKPHSKITKKTPEPVKHAVTSPPAPRAQVPPLADFDRKKARKIRTGRLEIEARIDLHGLRQAEAHAALKRFLHSCFNRGQQWVLVITGKGLSDAARHSSGDDTVIPSSSGRGVLKQNVPRWLNEPDLRAIVVSYAAAGIQHGGEGALYVHLRSRR